MVTRMYRWEIPVMSQFLKVFMLPVFSFLVSTHSLKMTYWACFPLISCQQVTLVGVKETALFVRYPGVKSLTFRGVCLYVFWGWGCEMRSFESKEGRECPLMAEFGRPRDEHLKLKALEFRQSMKVNSFELFMANPDYHYSSQQGNAHSTVRWHLKSAVENLCRGSKRKSIRACLALPKVINYYWS